MKNIKKQYKLKVINYIAQIFISINKKTNKYETFERNFPNMELPKVAKVKGENKPYYNNDDPEPEPFAIELFLDSSNFNPYSLNFVKNAERTCEFTTDENPIEIEFLTYDESSQYTLKFNEEIVTGFDFDCYYESSYYHNRIRTANPVLMEDF